VIKRRNLLVGASVVALMVAVGGGEALLEAQPAAAQGATAAELLEIASRDGTIVGPGLTRWFPKAIDLEPAADAVGLLVAGRNDFLAGEKLEPIYLREISFVKASPSRAG